MTLVINECYDSPEFIDGANASATRKCRVSGTEDYNVAYAAACTFANNHFRKFKGLSLDSVQVKPVPATDVWDIVYSYRKLGYDTDKVIDCKFSTTGGTIHIDHADTVVNYSCVPGLLPKNYGNGINLNSEGGFDGVDIKTGALTWTQTQLFPHNLIKGYRDMAYGMSTNINNAPFCGIPMGAVMFDGLTDVTMVREYDRSINEESIYWKVTFQFSVMPILLYHQVGLSPIFDKLSWDYLWVEWMKYKNGNSIDHRPRNVCVNRVYKFSDFGALGCIDPF